MTGIEDVARTAGVSKATASRALSGRGYVAADTRERVTRVAAELGYVPSASAASLATGRTRNIGVIMPYLNRWFFAEVLEGIQDALLATGHDLTLYDARPGTPGRQRVFEDFLARKRFDGLIAVGLEPDDRELDRLVAIGRPVVSVVGGSEQASAVRLDDQNTTRRATAHLLELGHRRIALFGSGIPRNASVYRNRASTYEEVMTAAGLTPRFVTSDDSIPGSYHAAVDLLGGDPASRPTAIVAVCDEAAIGALVAARRLGIAVPGALSVVGIDNHELAEMFGLTTFAQEPREQGATAVDLLLRHLADPTTPVVDLLVQARLIVRGSTGPPPGVPSVTVGVGLGTGTHPAGTVIP